MRRIIENVEAVMRRVFPVDPFEFGELDDHPMADVDRKFVSDLSKRMKRRGYVQKPVVVVGEDRRVIDGRHRVNAAQLAGVDVPTLLVSEEWFDCQVRRVPVMSLEDIAVLALSELGGD